MSRQSAVSKGTFRILRLFGIDIFLHWSWLVVALYELRWRADAYDFALWNAVEYLALFGLVLAHELGHALACRWVGGEALHIMLWPLGGVAYVRPPPRPGAQLVSLAAGPGVNLLLAPFLVGAAFGLHSIFPGASEDLRHLVVAIAYINVALLVFNMLPIYPLDGGQILRSLLWYVMGAERSLTVASGIGLVCGVAGGLAAVIVLDSWWLGLIGGYAAWRSWQGLRLSRSRQEVQARPRHHDLACPDCGEAPLKGAYWRCPNEHRFDLFATHDAACPVCGIAVSQTPCVFCGNRRPPREYWPRG